MVELLSASIRGGPPGQSHAAFFAMCGVPPVGPDLHDRGRQPRSTDDLYDVCQRVSAFLDRGPPHSRGLSAGEALFAVRRLLLAHFACSTARFLARVTPNGNHGCPPPATVEGGPCDAWGTCWRPPYGRDPRPMEHEDFGPTDRALRHSSSSTCTIRIIVENESA